MKHTRHLFVITLFLTLSAFCLFIYISNAEQAVNSDIISNDTELTLIIDAGHGGEDGGAVAKNGMLEKNINLQIALQTQQLAQLFGMQCIMTRTQDLDLADHSLPTIRKRKISDINARMAILENHPDAIYVGIHQNHYTDESANGLQVFYSGNNENSKPMADAIQSYTKAILQKENNRNIKTAGDNIYLLYHAKIPAVMVECGFISNQDELKKLMMQSYGTQLAMCVIGGLTDFYAAERAS